MAKSKRTVGGKVEMVQKRPYHVPLLDILGWLEPYVAKRVISSNWQSNNDSIQEQDQNRESESDENEDFQQ